MNPHLAGRLAPYLLLALLAVFSLGTKLSTVQSGAPYVTIDDQTMYEAGFMVWFGQVPPQRMYLESWLSGLTSIGTYVLRNPQEAAGAGVDLVASAYRDFHTNPDPYVLSYRLLALALDMATALLVFFLGRAIFREQPNRDWIAALAAGFYLLSFNTLWSYLVARPDTLTALLSALGLYLYYRSDFGEKRTTFLFSGVALGAATGMKLHAAFFVVVICLDVWRLLGFKEACRRLFGFGSLSVITFAVTAGSLLFDPALYVKLRLLNARDDASPWLEWGDQFITLLRGTGWLVVPLLLGTLWYARRSGLWRSQPRLGSLLFMSLCWLLLFASIRVLRAYWMLPALPLFYLAAAYGISQWSQRRIQWVAVALVVAVLAGQLWQEMRNFQSPDFNQLRQWVQSNIEPQEPFYVLGYLAVNLPRNTQAIENQNHTIERRLTGALEQGEPFTQRHIRLWEERAQQQLFNMLNFQSEQGFNYYGSNGFFPLEYPDILSLDDMAYIFVQDGFALELHPEYAQALEQDFTPVARVTGPGGGGQGLSYQIFKRN